MSQTEFQVTHYDLDATLSSGQAFRWESRAGAWEGVIAHRWIRLRAAPGAIQVQCMEPGENWDWVSHYLQATFDLEHALTAFPNDDPMRAAVSACLGLRLLRQDPWECLASFILSSTKQIVQIRQIVQTLCARFGERLTAPAECGPVYSFPTPHRLAALEECDLRACKMGFRAPYLQAAAQAVASGALNLSALAGTKTVDARGQLMQLPGVGPKIADCVLLFSFGFQDAFPVDVWVSKALRQLYFPRRKVTTKRLDRFSQTHFGPYAGYAQQYLFHYMRTRGRADLSV